MNSIEVKTKMSGTDGSSLYNNSKLCVCDVCGYRIKDGIRTHDRCESEQEEKTDEHIDETSETEQDDTERNPLECQCPTCERPKMNGARLCIKCYTENCKSGSVYSRGKARC
jgi:hypothetical protein